MKSLILILLINFVAPGLAEGKDTKRQSFDLATIQSKYHTSTILFLLLPKKLNIFHQNFGEIKGTIPWNSTDTSPGRHKQMQKHKINKINISTTPKIKRPTSVMAKRRYTVTYGFEDFLVLGHRNSIKQFCLALENPTPHEETAMDTATSTSSQHT